MVWDRHATVKPLLQASTTYILPPFLKYVYKLNNMNLQPMTEVKWKFPQSDHIFTMQAYPFTLAPNSF